MPSELDIYRTANLYIKQHGKDAETKAQQRADELWTSGDLTGGRVWLHIVNVVRELQSTEQER